MTSFDLNWEQTCFAFAKKFHKQLIHLQATGKVYGYIIQVHVKVKVYVWKKEEIIILFR